MMPKVKKPPSPKMPESALDKKYQIADDTGMAYKSLISTSPSGLARKADVKKKTLLGGAA